MYSRGRTIAGVDCVLTGLTDAIGYGACINGRHQRRKCSDDHESEVHGGSRVGGNGDSGECGVDSLWTLYLSSNSTASTCPYLSLKLQVARSIRGRSYLYTNRVHRIYRAAIVTAESLCWCWPVKTRSVSDSEERGMTNGNE